MRGSHLHNTYKEPSGLPAELNHTFIESPNPNRAKIVFKATGKEFSLFDGALDFYRSLKIGTHDGNHTANWMADMLAAGVEFVDTETVVEDAPAPTAADTN